MSRPILQITNLSSHLLIA